MIVIKYDKKFESSDFSFIKKNQTGFNDIFVIANYSLIAPNICKFFISYLYKYYLKKRWQLKKVEFYPPLPGDVGRPREVIKKSINNYYIKNL